MDELDQFLDNAPAPMTVGTLPLDAGSVLWLQSYAELEGVSFEQAIAWAVGEWRDFCLYPQEVERTLALAEIAEAECAEVPTAKKSTRRRARS